MDFSGISEKLKKEGLLSSGEKPGVSTEVLSEASDIEIQSKLVMENVQDVMKEVVDINDYNLIKDIIGRITYHNDELKSTLAQIFDSSLSSV